MPSGAVQCNAGFDLRPAGEIKLKAQKVHRCFNSTLKSNSQVDEIPS